MPAVNMNVTVSTFETEFDMKLKPNALGKNLYDTIVATTGIREVRDRDVYVHSVYFVHSRVMIS